MRVVWGLCSILVPNLLEREWCIEFHRKKIPNTKRKKVTLDILILYFSLRQNPLDFNLWILFSWMIIVLPFTSIYICANIILLLQNFINDIKINYSYIPVPLFQFIPISLFKIFGGFLQSVQLSTETSRNFWL